MALGEFGKTKARGRHRAAIPRVNGVGHLAKKSGRGQDLLQEQKCRVQERDRRACERPQKRHCRKDRFVLSPSEPPERQQAAGEKAREPDAASQK